MFTSALHNITIVNFSKSFSYLKGYFWTFRKKERKRAACWIPPFVQCCEASTSREDTKQHRATYPPGTQSDSPRGRRALSWSWWRGSGRPPWWPPHLEATNYPDPPASWDTWHTGDTGVTASQVWGSLCWALILSQMASVRPMIQVEIWKMPNTSSII